MDAFTFTSCGMDILRFVLVRVLSLLSTTTLENNLLDPFVTSLHELSLSHSRPGPTVAHAAVLAFGTLTATDCVSEGRRT
jgi:hypothetical protein